MTPRADRLGRLLAAHRTRRVRLVDVHAAFERVAPDLAGSGDRRRALAADLAELEGTGLLKRSRGTDVGRPPLPDSVLMAAGPLREAPPQRRAPWHTDLHRDGRGPDVSSLSGDQLARLTAVDRWLWRHADSAQRVPVQERALEITGREKAFRDLPQCGGLVTEDVLRVRVVPAPLSQVHRVGAGGVVLVVENLATFDSLRRVLSDRPGAVGSVVFGKGREFGSALVELAETGPIEEIRYFGDLDKAGLEIPAGASVRAVAVGLPPVLPATGLYAALLAHGAPAATEKPVGADRTDTLVTWLAPGHRAAVRAHLLAGRRLAQEAVGLDLLTSPSAPAIP